MSFDVEQALVTYLSAHPDLAAYPAGTVGVYYDGSPPKVVIERIGGLADYLAAVDHPRVDVTVWHTDRGAAQDLAQTIRRILHQDIAGAVSDGVVFAGTTEFLGLRFVVDEASETPRFMFSVEITISRHP